MALSRLSRYIGKNVKLVDIDGKEWVGKATSVDLAINYDDIEFDELDLKVDGYSGVFAFPENEIKSIKVIG